MGSSPSSPSNPSCPSCPSSPATGYLVKVGTKGSATKLVSNKVPLSIKQLALSLDKSSNQTSINTMNFSAINNYITNPNSINTLSTMLNSTTVTQQPYNTSTDFDTYWGARFHIQRIDTGNCCGGNNYVHYVSYVNIPGSLPTKVRFRPVVTLKQYSGSTRSTNVQIALYDTPRADAYSWPIGDYGGTTRKWISSIQSVTCPNNTGVSVAFDDQMTGYANLSGDTAAYVMIGVQDAVNTRYTISFTFEIDWLTVV